MSKISELSDGGAIQSGDTLIAVRSGGNVKVTYGGTTTANIDGGTIDGTVIGGSSAAAGSFTTISASGEIAANGGVAFGDNDMATFGASDDLQIYHDGSNSYISDQGTGDLTVLANKFLVKSASGGSTFIEANPTATDVTLFYGNAVKLATTATGIDVTGTVTADGLDVTGSTLELTTSTYKGLKINHSDGSTDQVLYISPVADTVGSYIQNNASYSSSFNYTPEYTNSSGIEFDKDGDIYLRANSGLTVGTNFIPTNRLRVQPNGDISFYEDTGTTAKFFWDASAESLGIGTTSPSVALDVTGTINATTGLALTGNAAQVTTTYAGNTTSRFYTSTSGLNLTVDGAWPLIFSNASTERMRIDSSGKVGIGTSSPSSYDADFNGLVVSAANASGMTIASGTASAGTLAFADGTTGNEKYRGYVQYFHGDDSLRFGASGGEQARIDSSGNLLVGTTTTDVGSAKGFTALSSGLMANTVSGGVVAVLNRLASDGEILRFRKDGTTVGSIGNLGGSAYYSGASTGVYFGTNDVVPTNGSGSFADNAKDLGASSYRFQDIYATNALIQTSDRNEKQDIAELDEAERRVAVAAKGLLRKFRWKDAVEEKGDDARIHFGIIAQDLQAAFEAEGLDAGRYAMFIHTTWTDEETGEERSRMGVRYSELLAFIIAAI